MQTLVSLYADDALDVSLILTIVEYAISENKKTIGFISKTAEKWIAAGVTTLEDSAKYLEKLSRQKSAWVIVEKAFGIEHRLPSDKELQFSEKWVVEWGFKRDMLKAAYDVCVDAKAKVSMPYIDKILEGWHKNGYKTPDDTKAKPKTKQIPQKEEHTP